MMLRKAKLRDVDRIFDLLQAYAKEGLLLPRTRQSICESLSSFFVVDQEGEVVATAALHILGDDLAEIRSLAVVKEQHGKGLGKLLVNRLFEEAQELEIPRVLALTYQQAFFERCAFVIVEKAVLHRKIWKDCIHCKKFPLCDEIAMVRATTFYQEVELQEDTEPDDAVSDVYMDSHAM